MSDEPRSGEGLTEGPPPPPTGPAPADRTTTEDEPPRSFSRWMMEQLRTWGPAILAVIIIRTFIFEPFKIPSPSMVPTLLIGDHVLVTKFSYGIWLRIPFTEVMVELLDIGDPSPGDVAVFIHPKTGENYIKRIVAVPGDRIQVIGNQVLINGKAQPQEHEGTYTYADEQCTEQVARLYQEDLQGVPHAVLKDFTPRDLADMTEVTVPEDTVFVMGDNRDHSADSREGLVMGTMRPRSFSFVDQKLIKGKAHFIWLSFDHCGGWGSIRGERLFRSLYNPDIPPHDSVGVDE